MRCVACAADDQSRSAANVLTLNKIVPTMNRTATCQSARPGSNQVVFARRDRLFTARSYWPQSDCTDPDD